MPQPTGVRVLRGSVHLQRQIHQCRPQLIDLSPSGAEFGATVAAAAYLSERSQCGLVGIGQGNGTVSYWNRLNACSTGKGSGH